MRKVTLITTLTILGILALSFLAEAGVVWLARGLFKAAAND